MTIFKGVGCNALAKAFTFTLTTATSIVLARSLVPRDYGIVGFALIFINFLMQFGDFGLNTAVIQRKDLDLRGLHTAFTIKLLFGIVLTLALMALAPLARNFFDDSAIVKVIRILSLSIIINSFSFLPQTLLTRELNFVKLILPQVGSAVVNCMVSVLLVFNGFNYWSIVIGNLCAVAASCLILNGIRPVLPRLAFDRTIAFELLHFGSRLFTFSIISFAVFNLDNLVIGAVGGSALLGNYAVAFNWGTLICSLLTSTVLVVLLPAFSKYEQDRDKIKKSFLHAMAMTSLFSVLANLSLFIISREFLVLILSHGTDKWMPAFVALRILCIYGIGRSLLEPTGILLVAVGTFRPLLKAALTAAVLEIGLLYPVLNRFGIEGVALLVVASYLTQYLFYYPALKAEIDVSFGEILGSVGPAVAAGFSMLFIVELALTSYLPVSLCSGIAKIALNLSGFLGIYGLLSKWQFLKGIGLFIRGQRA